MVVIRKVKDEERRQRKVIAILFAVTALIFFAVLYEYYFITRYHPVPSSVDGLSATLQRWRSEGFVRGFDIASATLIVNKAKWRELPHHEQLDIMTQVARYCAEKNGQKWWSLRVISSSDKGILAELGPKGFVFN